MTKQSPKPIDVALEEIKALKLVVVQLRKEIRTLRNDVIPLKDDLVERKKKDVEEDASYEKVKTNSWWGY